MPGLRHPVSVTSLSLEEAQDGRSETQRATRYLVAPVRTVSPEKAEPARLRWKGGAILDEDGLWRTLHETSPANVRADTLNVCKDPQAQNAILSAMSARHSVPSSTVFREGAAPEAATLVASQQRQGDDSRHNGGGPQLESPTKTKFHFAPTPRSPAKARACPAVALTASTPCTLDSACTTPKSTPRESNQGASRPTPGFKGTPATKQQESDGDAELTDSSCDALSDPGINTILG